MFDVDYPQEQMMNNTTGKGKQATKGQKQIFDENKSTIKYYTTAAIVSSMVYFAVVTYFVFQTSTWEWIGFAISVMVQIGAVLMMRKMAVAVKNEKGQLVDAGLDLNQEGGFGEYCKDAVILTSMVNCTAVFWNKLFFALLLIPMYALYKLWIGILAPYFFAPSMDSSDDGADEKKQRKRERVKMKRI